MTIYTADSHCADYRIVEQEKEAAFWVDDFWDLLPCKRPIYIAIGILALIFGISSLGIALIVDRLISDKLQTGCWPKGPVVFGLAFCILLTIVTALVGFGLSKKVKEWTTVAVASAASSSAFAIAGLGAVFRVYHACASASLPIYATALIVLLGLWMLLLILAICLSRCRPQCPTKQAIVSSSIAFFATGHAVWTFGRLAALYIQISDASVAEIVLLPFYASVSFAIVLVVASAYFAYRLAYEECADLGVALRAAAVIVVPIALNGFLRVVQAGIHPSLPFVYTIGALTLLTLLLLRACFKGALFISWALVVLSLAIGQAMVKPFVHQTVESQCSSIPSAFHQISGMLLRLQIGVVEQTPLVESIFSAEGLFWAIVCTLVFSAFLLVFFAFFQRRCEPLASTIFGIGVGTFGYALIGMFAEATKDLSCPLVAKFWLYFGAVVIVVLLLIASILHCSLRCRKGVLTAAVFFLSISLAAVGLGQFFGTMTTQMINGCRRDALELIVLALAVLLALVLLSLLATLLVLQSSKHTETALSIAVASVGTGSTLALIGKPIALAASHLACNFSDCYLDLLTQRLAVIGTITVAPQLLQWLFEPVYITSAIASLAASLSASGIASMLSQELEAIKSNAPWIPRLVGRPIVISVSIYVFVVLALELWLLVCRPKSKCYRFGRLLPLFVVPSYAYGVGRSILGGLASNEQVSERLVKQAFPLVLCSYAPLVLVTLVTSYRLALCCPRSCLSYLPAAIASLATVLFVGQASIEDRLTFLAAVFKHFPCMSLHKFTVLAVALLAILLLVPTMFSLFYACRKVNARLLGASIASFAFVLFSYTLGSFPTGVFQSSFDTSFSRCIFLVLWACLPSIAIDIVAAFGIVVYLCWLAP